MRAAASFRGRPLALFALVMAGWVGARAALWEAPVQPAPIPVSALTSTVPAMHDQPPQLRQPRAAPQPGARALVATSIAPPRKPQPAARPAIALVIDAAPQRARSDLPAGLVARPGVSPVRPLPQRQPGQYTAPQPAERWSLDAWGYFRQGSDSAPISQGRVPIYGASQIGAIAQFRLAPASRHDPRAYLRAYRALVARGESEGALGASVRPLPNLPLRAFAEVRYIETPLARELRPSVFVVTELPPQALPGDFTLEAYGQAGWVGGGFATPFADGQVSLARELARFTAPGAGPLRLSAGAGVWGGAQKGAERLDIGPTVRAEWTMGRVPARLSIDWREQVAGDAAPGSGMAATLSTSF